MTLHVVGDVENDKEPVESEVFVASHDRRDVGVISRGEGADVRVLPQAALNGHDQVISIRTRTDADGVFLTRASQRVYQGDPTLQLLPTLADRVSLDHGSTGAFFRWDDAPLEFEVKDRIFSYFDNGFDYVILEATAAWLSNRGAT